jgi:hypothetical protein
MGARIVAFFQTQRYLTRLPGLIRLCEDLRIRHGQGLDMQRYCSWCYELTDHELVENPRVGRARYVCLGKECGQPTVLCLAPGCSHTARSTGNSADLLCHVHNGAIASFERLKATIADPTEFVGLFKREEHDYARYGKLLAHTVGGAAVVSPLAFLAAPALGGAIGAYFLGLSGAAATSAGLAVLGGGSLGAGGFGMFGGTCVLTALGTAAGGWKGWELSNKYLGDVEGFDIKKIRDGIDPALVLVDGFCTQGDADGADWLSGLGDVYWKHAAYHVQWESKRLHDLMLLVMTTNGIKPLILANVAAQAKRFASANILPLAALLGLANLLGNPFHVAMAKADKTGELLKTMLLRCKDRSFILLGHSLGARVVMSALSSYGMTDDATRHSRIVGAHLLGGAVGKDPCEAWEPVANAVDRQCISYFSSADQVLNILYKLSMAFLSDPTGLGPIPTNDKTRKKIISVNALEHVKGHDEYKRNLSKFINAGMGIEAH